MNLGPIQFLNVLRIKDLLKQQIQTQDGFYRDKCFLTSLELLLDSIANIQGLSSRSNDTQDQLIREFKFLVQSNHKAYYNIAWYSKALCMSDKTLSRYVMKNLKKSPKQYIIKVILSSLKKELVDTDSNIKAILLNYSMSESQLHRLFKKHVSYTMSEYRSYDR